MFYADLKIPDSEKHLRYTGQHNHMIIDNITSLSHNHHNITLRIPRVNDSEEDICGFGRIIKGFGDGIRGIELLRYNNLAASKYAISGREYRGFAQDSQTDREMNELCLAMEKSCDLHCYFV